MTARPAFLDQSECATLIADGDWSGTALGPVAGWPGWLTATLGTILRAPSAYAVIHGSDNRVLYNDAYGRIAGDRHPAMFGRPVTEGWPETAEFKEIAVARVKDGETVTRRDEPLVIHRDTRETTGYFSIAFSPVPGSDGATAAVLVGMVETTARVRALADLARVNNDLEREIVRRVRDRDRVWQMANDLIGTAGFDGYMRAINPAYARVFGWSEEEMRGRPFTDFLVEEDREPTAAVSTRLLAGETVKQLVNRVRTKSGDTRTIMWTAVPDPEGNVFHLVGRDLTEQHRTEQALRQAQKMEAVGQLTGGMAHDFNNMLAGVSGSLEIMKVRLAQGRTADVERYLEAALGAARRAATLTHRLLAFSRTQALDPAPTDLNVLVREIADMIERTIGVDIAFETLLGGALPTVLIDRSRLESALVNLCINARDAIHDVYPVGRGPSEGRIVVETRELSVSEAEGRARDLPPGRYASLCVSDNGAGMSRDTASRAFDPFFTTKPPGEGTGLGLSMVYGFARQSAGQVRIETEMGGGSSVCIDLPAIDAPVVRDVEPPQPPALRARRGETVLLVDDEATIRMLVTDVLGDLGYEVVTASDGPSALRVLRTGDGIDLLITDVGLPGGMNGRQLFDTARETRPDLRVLFITGYAENDALSHGPAGPGVPVLTKPFTITALAERVSQILMR